MDVDYTKYSPGMELGGRVGAVPMSACLVCGRTCNAKGSRSKRYIHAVRIYRKKTLGKDGKPGKVSNALEVLQQCKLNEKQIELLKEIDDRRRVNESATQMELAHVLYCADHVDPSKQQMKATAKLLGQLVAMKALEVTSDRVPRWRRPASFRAQRAA